MIVEKQRVAYEQRLLQLQQKIEVMIREKTFLEARCVGLDKDYNASLVRETAVIEEAAQLRQEYIALKANYDTIEQNLSEASSELRAKHHAMETKNRELIECQLRLKMADTKIASLENALSAADDKIMTLRDDYLFATQAKANLEEQVKQLVNKETQERVS